MDLVGPARVKSIGGSLYTLVIVDDYSRFAWTMFLSSKDETFDAFNVFAKKVQNEKGVSIVSIRTDHGGEFDNHALESFCDENGIDHNFSAPRTPQQNGVVERKNRVLTEMARTMLNEKRVSQTFWADAMSTACYISNRAYIRTHHKKTPYELYKGRKPNIAHLRIFGSKCFIHNNDKQNLGKFDPKSDEGIFLGYSNHSKAYRVFNKRTGTVEESVHVVFVENENFSKSPEEESESIITNLPTSSSRSIITPELSNDKDSQLNPSHSTDWKYLRNHPLEQVIGEVTEGVRTRKAFNKVRFSAFISEIEPSCIARTQSLSDNASSMQDVSILEINAKNLC